MVLQLLPVRQTVKYFFIDNQTAEENLHIDKGATKNFRLLDEDYKCKPVMDYLSHHFTVRDTMYPFHTELIIPPFYTAEIPTPLPNNA